MKKLSALFVLTFLFLTAGTTFAQENKEEIKKEIKQDKVEVAVADLPEAVQKTLNETYAGFEVKKAYKKGEKSPKFYAKLEKDGKKIKVTLDENGKVLAQKDIESKAKIGDK